MNELIRLKEKMERRLEIIQKKKKKDKKTHNKRIL